MNKTTAIISALALAGSLTVAADESKAPEKKAQTSAESTDASPKATAESPLVKAARDAKAKRDAREGEKSRISITNDDVEKSAGKLIQSSSKPLDPLPPVSDVEKSMRDVAAAKAPSKSKQAELQESVDKYQKEVTNLERELRRIEETYYNEDDPDYREDVLANNFDETKTQLEAARKELAAARKALAAAGGN